MFCAATSGLLRQIENLKAERYDAHKFSGDGWGAHIDGALAELAVAKALNHYWLPVVSGDPRRLTGDVGDYQVRSTTIRAGSLIIHPTDPDNARFFLVINTTPTYNVVGSILGSQAKDPRWWRTDTGRPAFFVPQQALDPIQPQVYI